MMVTLSFAVAGVPFTMNAVNQMHHRVYANKRAWWRDAFTEQATGHPALAWADITVDHIKATRRNVDVAAAAACAKAALDGIVNAGVLPDDSPEYVRSIRFNAPEHQPGIDALVLTLVGEPSGG